MRTVTAVFVVVCSTVCTNVCSSGHFLCSSRAKACVILHRTGRSSRPPKSETPPPTHYTDIEPLSNGIQPQQWGFEDCHAMGLQVTFIGGSRRLTQCERCNGGAQSDWTGSGRSRALAAVRVSCRLKPVARRRAQGSPAKMPCEGQRCGIRLINWGRWPCARAHRV